MSTAEILLITPPFTQLNTPYPATAYLKGFLNTLNISSIQADLGIEVILKIFDQEGLRKIFASAESKSLNYSAHTKRMLSLKDQYLQTINEVILFLQNKNPNLAHLICTGNFLPEASRFQQMSDLEWAFGAIGIQDKAKHLATLYLEDISDFIIENVDAHFGFSRYAERLSRSARSFDELYNELQKPYSLIDETTASLLDQKIKSNPDIKLLGITAPFPGNLFSAFRCAQWVKEKYPHIKVCLGGGFANTELRSLSEKRVFDFFDFVCLDDGEATLQQLVLFIRGTLPKALLKRTFCIDDENVSYINGSIIPDYKQEKVGTPDYDGLLLDQYISVLEVANPMHRLWSDGTWIKMTLAHGCYWGKCTFCDISLDYIKNYEATTASVLADRIEELIQKTKQRSVHFVDEAAPPALMKALAIEILNRKLKVVWWTNIRFEKSFSPDLCKLLAASGCIAVSGGLEVASDRLLALINKGVTIEQVAQVTNAFTDAGIMVHAYLMYGFPTQTSQETIDALEVVRQLFQANVIQSGFWHQFAMTAHSPIGITPKTFQVINLDERLGSFANNDLEHKDPTGTNHQKFSQGLKKSLFNYMHGLCFEFPLQEWFDFRVPKTTIHPRLIERFIQDRLSVQKHNPTQKIIWIGGVPKIARKGKNDIEIIVQNLREQYNWNGSPQLGNWLIELLTVATPGLHSNLPTVQEIQQSYKELNQGDFEAFWHSDLYLNLREMGLIIT